MRLHRFALTLLQSVFKQIEKHLFFFTSGSPKATQHLRLRPHRTRHGCPPLPRGFGSRGAGGTRGGTHGASAAVAAGGALGGATALQRNELSCASEGR